MDPLQSSNMKEWNLRHYNTTESNVQVEQCANSVYVVSPGAIRELRKED